jgi:F-type H+-transporting ATPase subunit delta
MVRNPHNFRVISYKTKKMSSNKSFSTETSERYSRALFEVAKDSGELEKIETDIKNFQLILNSSLELQNFTQNPTQSINIQNNVIDLISKKLDFSKNTNNFLSLLIKKRRIFFVKKILDSFLRLCSNKRGEIKASLISSKELSAIELENISKELSLSMGSKIKFDYKVNKDLIGGLKLQLGSFMIDTSIRNKLKKYEQLMLEN